ncbi:hypothetical protein AB0O76_36940 [Streptomyces sp. NPDC086554]|uniref:hypothetical protein n=1 Tax=Streptomyces sp. NPDC086554 TaxID=3154864 RepID=UPI0034451B05
MTDTPPPPLEEWALGAHNAIRAMVDSVGGDVAVFDHDPLTFQTTLDDFVTRLPFKEFEEDDWIWLHSQLVAYTADILIRNYGGRWARLTDASLTPSHRYLIAAVSQDGVPRHIDLHSLVFEHLHPVPQRIPRLIERVLDAAGFSPQR